MKKNKCKKDKFLHVITLYVLALLKLVRSLVLSIWDARKYNLYSDHSDATSSSCPLTGGPTSYACVCGFVVNGVSAMAAS